MSDAYQTLNLILVRHKPGWGSEMGEARDYILPCDTSFRHLIHCADIMTLLHVPPFAVTLPMISREIDRRPEVWRVTNGGRTGHAVVGSGTEKSDLGFLFAKACVFVWLPFSSQKFSELLSLLWSPCIFPVALCSHLFVNVTAVYCCLHTLCCMSF